MDLTPASWRGWNRFYSNCLYMFFPGKYCFILMACLLGIQLASLGQQDGGHKLSADGLADLPTHFLGRLQKKTTDLEDRLTRQTEKYLQKMAHREEKIRQRLYKLDSNAAKGAFAGTQSRYTDLAERLRTDTGSKSLSFSGEYLPYADSLQGVLKFLKDKPGAASSLRQLQALQAKMEDADQVKQFIRDRKEQIKQLLSQYTRLPAGVSKEYQGLNRDVYYYSQQVREYKGMLNDPDKLAKKALALLNQLPAFQAFMKQNSQLAGLFSLPGNYGSPASLTGLQTRDQVAALINQQVMAGGAGGQAALQANLQSAQSQLDGYKDKLSKLGGGSGDIDMPDFKPNEQKTKSFWKRLEYGTNFQTTRNNYAFPTVSDFGLSVGYKVTDRSTVGIGVSYKLGWGNGIRHIAFSSQGAGLRSFVDIKIKGSFSASGGLEYNYTTPFRSIQQLYHWDNWTRSGLLGISKTVAMKSRVFKKTKLQLLWDFLSYGQRPRTQPILFRINYNF